MGGIELTNRRIRGDPSVALCFSSDVDSTRVINENLADVRQLVILKDSDRLSQAGGTSATLLIILKYLSPPPSFVVFIIP